MRTKHFVTILVLLVLAVPASPAHAGGVVSICDETHLLAALAGGGTVTFSCSGTIILTAEIAIAADTTIDGSGQTVTISGNNAVRVFTVNPGVALSLNELTVANGSASTGGGIFVDDSATLNVSNSTFSSNTASGWGGDVRGGGIHNRGTLNVSNCTFSENSAGDGGAIYNAGGTTDLNNCTFSGNSARWYTGGGGIYNHWGSMTVSDSTFSGNNAYYGVGILNGDGGWLTISNSTFSGNSAGAGGAGGGIANWNMLTVRSSTFSGNVALDGGGIRNYAGMLTVSDSTFSGNSAGQLGGGILNAPTFPGSMVTVSNSTFSGNGAGLGGGIVNFGYGSTLVSNSSFSGNSAGAGGGIFNGSTLTVSNSSFSGNSTNSDGGGIYNFGTLTMNNSTFSGNRAGAGIFNEGGGGTVTLKNTIVANNVIGANCSGPIIDGGGNLSYPDTTCPGINADPLLGPLQNNGGPTETMALGPGSAALDAADDAICAAPPVNNLDQRGITRPQGPHCDIGAVEQIQEPTAVSLSALGAQSLPDAMPSPVMVGLLLAALVGAGVRRRCRRT